MSNTDKRNGFNLITSGGRQPRRVKRYYDGSDDTAIFPGDAYTIEADGNVAALSGGTEAPNGIVEALDLTGINEGPTSYDYFPVGVAGYVIGIEDDDAEFEVTTSATITADYYDTGAEVDVDVGTAGSTSLRQSRMAVGDAGGDQFRLVRPVDRQGNDKYAQYARVVVKLIPANVQ